VGYVAQPIEFTVNLRGRGADAKAGRHLSWNFGDTHTASGQQVTHQYPYPGTYIVTVRGTYRDLDDILVRHEITILPVALALTRNRDGAVQLSNTAKYELALGGYTVVAAGEEYTLPPDTFLKPNATITLPPQTFTASNAAVVAVHDQAKQVVAYQVPGASRPAPTPQSPSRPVAYAPAPGAAADTVSTNTNFSFAQTAPTVTPTPQIAATSTSNTPAAVSDTLAQTASVINAIPTAAASESGRGASTDTRPANSTAYLALIALLALATIALLARRVE
jgi:hypothetical protein